jgi:hypothetical protein
MGLLDITHIRFFTDQDLLRTFYQTGFRVATRSATVCARSQEVYQRHTGRPYPQTIELEGATIEVASEAELTSFCALQHVFNLAPARYEALSPDERLWIDAPHPETLAFAGVKLPPAGG